TALARRRAPKLTRFPYTTLFRSQENRTRAQPRTVSAHPRGRDILQGGMMTGQTDRLPVLAWLQKSLDGTLQETDVTHMQYPTARSEEHTSELQSRENLVCRLLLE